MKAKGRKPAGQMNAVETAYAKVLQARKDAGQITDYRYEPMALVLADNTRYKPDFLVIDGNGYVEFHEVKGRIGNGPGGWMDDARVKIKVAARLFPWFRFVGACAIAKKHGGGFHYEEFSSFEEAA